MSSKQPNPLHSDVSRSALRAPLSLSISCSLFLSLLLSPSLPPSLSFSGRRVWMGLERRVWNDAGGDPDVWNEVWIAFCGPNIFGHIALHCITLQYNRSQYIKCYIHPPHMKHTGLHKSMHFHNENSILLSASASRSPGGHLNTIPHKRYTCRCPALSSSI